MKHGIFAIVMATLFLPATGVAQETALPETGSLRDDLFLPELDALCGVGRQLSKGCDAIRARVRVDASAPPWNAVGRVNFASTQVSQHCTGTLLSPRLVLTASHCLYNFPRKSWIPAQSVRFAAGYHRGSATAVAKVERYILDPVHDIESRDFKAEMAQDWALLVLAEPIGPEAGVMPAFSLAIDGAGGTSFAVVGYPALRPHVLSIADDCGAPEFYPLRQVILQKCATMSGDSGAPMVAITDGEIVLRGVFVGVYVTGSGYVSVSIPIAQFQEYIDLATQ